MSVTETEREEALRSAERPATRQADPERIARSGWASKLLDIVIAIGGVALVIAVATIPLRPREQAIFAVISAVVFLVVNRFPSRGVTLFLVMLSLSVSLRYIFWRATETLEFGSFLELFLGMGLVVAEIYAIIVLVLGYIQTVWPLHRVPMPLPDDPDTWPTVDVYVPTYSEPMRIVRATVLAAMMMDWPRDKMRVWLLDDGKREEFRLFAEAAGCGYITRTENKHAKAGNLNNAMQVTDGEYICVFDCDHIPTRAFLQMTMGWMIADRNLALIQTPHHFYSPDPFQRNLRAGTRVPAEGNMFYGLVQDGNDYWNATFFCGSCAVLRRTALETVGGFAVETVTEDAHTMLKMHRKGWDSAYLRLPLAAGLATERLAIHIGQRIRWARGMIQILRVDNPLFGPGLTIGQRICYLQAMGHFLFALPRIVFLTSPLAYLLADQNVIAASPLAITAFALPHIFHSVATNSRVQQNWRHSFWSEIYETVLAFFLVRVTLVTLVAPKRGKFNVTAKGGLLENGFFDLAAVYPNLILALFLIVGIIRGIVGMLLIDYGSTQRSATDASLIFQALLLNSIWATFSLLTVMAALAVGRETRQIRSRARINANLPISIYLPDGRVITGHSRDLSQGGGSLIADRPPHFVDGTDVEVELPVGDQAVLIPARILRWDETGLQARWQPTTIDEEARLVQAVFGRADAWTDWAAYKRDQPMASLYRVLVSIGGLFRPPDRAPKPTRSRQPPGAGGESLDVEDDVKPPISRQRQLAGTTAMVVGLLMLTIGGAAAQQMAQTTVRPIPQMVAPLPPLAPPPPSVGATQIGLAPAPLPSAGGGPPGPTPGLPQGANTLNGPVAGATMNTAPQLPTGPGSTETLNRVGTRRVEYKLSQLGAQLPIRLTGTSTVQGVEFGVRADEVVVDAQLHVTGATGPRLIPEFSEVSITLNEQNVGTIPANVPEPANNYDLTFPVSPVFFQDSNRLNFRFAGRYTRECNDPLSLLLWAIVNNSSTLTLTLDRLPPQRDISRLPLPFFDPREKLMLNLPFILPGAAGNDTLKVAGMAASWFGQLAAYRGTTFPVVSEPPAEGNSVMVVVAADGNVPSFLPPINGPTLAVVANPNDSLSSILVIAGRTGEEATNAGIALVLGARGISGQVAVVQPVEVPPRVPYDAPNWVPTNRPVKFGELVDSSDLQINGYTGLVHVPFNTAPDFITWRDHAFPADIKYRAPPAPIINPDPSSGRDGLAVSRLDVGINDKYITTFPLAPIDRRDSWFSRLFSFGVAQLEGEADLPVYTVFGGNDMTFFFDARPLHRGECVAVPNDLRMGVDPDSTIDLSAGHRFADMPNLAYFVNSGFPFTRMADLSQTVVVVPDRPSSVEVSAYLNMMGRIGALTGYPATHMALVRPDGASQFADRDVLMIGSIPRMQAAADLLRNAPVRLNGNRLVTEVSSDPLTSVRRVFGDRGDLDINRQRLDTRVSAGIDETTAVMEGAESPMRSGHSLVAILAASPQGLDRVIATFRDPDKAPKIQGDVSIMSSNEVTSYRAGSVYHVGTLPIWMLPGWALRDQPYGAVALMLVGCVLLGFAFYWAMRRRADMRAMRRRRADMRARETGTEL
jgi:cellulose synthase (UDP-forming)